MINLLSKTHDFIKMINLLNRTHDFIKIDRFANKIWKGLPSDKTKKKSRFADKDLSSWTGLGDPNMTEVRLLVKFRMLRVQN